MSQVSGGERVYDPIVIAEAGIALSAECPKQERSITQSDGSGLVYFQSAGALTNAQDFDSIGSKHAPRRPATANDCS